MRDRDIYSAQVVRQLFDEMSGTYGFVNMIASLGFTIIWRRVVVSKLRQLGSGLVVVDLMTGMGELYGELRRQMPEIQKVVGIDFSSKMCARARQVAIKSAMNIQVSEADVFYNDINSDSIDCVICSFGLKTFSMDQQKKLAAEVNRILRPGWHFCLVSRFDQRTDQSISGRWPL